MKPSERERFTPNTKGFNVGDCIRVVYPPYLKGCKGKITGVLPSCSREVKIYEGNGNEEVVNNVYTFGKVTSLCLLSIIPEDLFKL